jgi:exonuclease VII small subunit
MTNKTNLQNSLRELQAITQWFDEQETIDIEQALEKVKVGAALLKDLQGELKDIKNEFTAIKADLEETL